MKYAGQILSLKCGEQTLSLKQVNRRAAKKAFEAGKTVWLHPCNMRFNNMWQSPCPIRKDDESLSTVVGNAFTTLVNSYTYYNCIKELGSYPNYFIEIPQ